MENILAGLNQLTESGDPSSADDGIPVKALFDFFKDCIIPAMLLNQNAFIPIIAALLYMFFAGFFQQGRGGSGLFSKGGGMNAAHIVTAAPAPPPPSAGR